MNIVIATSTYCDSLSGLLLEMPRLLQRRVCSSPFPPFANVRELQLALHALIPPRGLHDTSFVACQHGPVGSGATTVTGIGGAPDAHGLIVGSLAGMTG